MCTLFLVFTPAKIGLLLHTQKICNKIVSLVNSSKLPLLSFQCQPKIQFLMPHLLHCVSMNSMPLNNVSF